MITSIYFIYFEIRRNYLYHNAENINGILSDEEIDKLQSKNLRKQLISYDNPELLDSLAMIYVFPVSLKSLLEPNPINGLLDLY